MKTFEYPMLYASLRKDWDSIMGPVLKVVLPVSISGTSSTIWSMLPPSRDSA
jgi:hypothetical protein